MITRRQFLTAAALIPLAGAASCHSSKDARRGASRSPARFFFTSQGKTALMNADGTGERRLTMRGSYNTSPRFGPTGLVAFAGMDDFVSDLFTVDMSGNINRLTQQQGSNKDPAWSPDGRWLVFLSDRAGAWRVFLMTEDGRYQFPVTGKGEPWGTPDWR